MVGNPSNYTKIDILRCFLHIDKNISRNDLMKILDIGEGSTRTILDVLKSKNLIRSTRQGHSLTYKGSEIRKKINRIISLPKRLNISLYPDHKKIGLVIKGIDVTEVTIEKRDIAVKNGADGCLIFSYKNNKLNLLIFNLKQNFEQLNEHFKLQDKDILVITFADAYKWAEISSLAVAIALNKELNGIFNSLC